MACAIFRFLRRPRLLLRAVDPLCRHGQQDLDRRRQSEIGRSTSLSRNTVEIWWKNPTGDLTRYRREDAKLLTGRIAIWPQSLKANVHRHKRDLRTALHIEWALTGSHVIFVAVVRSDQAERVIERNPASACAMTGLSGSFA